MNTTGKTQEEQLKELQEERERLDRTTKILIAKDVELQKTYESLENAYNQVEKEKREIQAERNKLSAVLGGITDAIISLNSDGVIVTFNPAAESLTGYTAAEILGKPFSQVITLKESHAPINDLILQNNTYKDSPILQKESIEVTGKNKTATVRLLCRRIASDLGNNVGLIMSLHDTSEQKQLEEMKLDFVSMAAHELRTPLTSISGYLSVFIRENEDKFNDEQMSFLNRIRLSTQRLYALVENLLSVSKIERNGLTINKKQIDWVSHVREIIQDFHNLAREQRVTLTFQEPQEILPHLIVDPLRIDEVLSNLITNAINYTKTDGHVKVSIEKKDGMLVTSVVDDGPGIPESALPHLFTKFFRVSGKLEQGSKGTGLGLYISKAIVDMHDGKIWVESEVGRGSTFRFALPISQTP